MNYVSTKGYLVDQKNAYLTRETLFSKHAYLGYLPGQKKTKTCLRNLHMAPYYAIAKEPTVGWRQPTVASLAIASYSVEDPFE